MIGKYMQIDKNRYTVAFLEKRMKEYWQSYMINIIEFVSMSFIDVVYEFYVGEVTEYDIS